MDTTIEVLLRAAEFIELQQQHHQQSLFPSPVSATSIPPKMVQKCHSNSTPLNDASLHRLSSAMRIFSHVNFTHDISTNEHKSHLFTSKPNHGDQTKSRRKHSQEFQEYVTSRPESNAIGRDR